MDDGNEQHLREVGENVRTTVEDLPGVPKEPIERIEEARERRRIVEERIRTKRQELAQMRRGLVLEDHGDGEEDEDLFWKPQVVKLPEIQQRDKPLYYTD